MTLMSARPTRRYRAPQQHGQSLVIPPFEDAASLLSSNLNLTNSYVIEIQGRSLASLRFEAKQDLYQRALDYTGQYLSIDRATTAPESIVLSGHQPTLFHPGVWFKNFALDHLGKQQGIQPINLVIDNDVATNVASTIRVPAGDADHPRIEQVAIDDSSPETPFEDRAIVNLERVQSFSQRIIEFESPLIQDPLIKQLWKPIDEVVKRTNRLGQVLSQTRHIYEHQLGLQTLEVPLSHLCGGQAYLWFASHLFAHLPRLWEIYNSSLREYRKRNRLRSRTHPVADLAEEDGWLEAPFWIWTKSDPKRRRLFVRQASSSIEITDRESNTFNLDLSAESSAATAVQQLAQIQSEGMRIRPRALMTTMFARLFLSDVFLHGIGGAKYDELTDEIIRVFFEIEPPEFFVLTSTITLPVGCSDVSEQDLRKIDRQLRDLTFNPDRFLRTGELGDPKVELMCAEKQRLIEKDSTREDRHERHQEITKINELLQPKVAQTREKLVAQRADFEQQIRNNAILTSREWSFCLFPEKTLASNLLELFPKQA